MQNIWTFYCPKSSPQILKPVRPLKLNNTLYNYNKLSSITCGIVILIISTCVNKELSQQSPFLFGYFWTYSSFFLVLLLMSLAKMVLITVEKQKTNLLDAKITHNRTAKVKLEFIKIHLNINTIKTY